MARQLGVGVGAVAFLAFVWAVNGFWERIERIGADFGGLSVGWGEGVGGRVYFLCGLSADYAAPLFWERIKRIGADF